MKHIYRTFGILALVLCLLGVMTACDEKPEEPPATEPLTYTVEVTCEDPILLGLEVQFKNASGTFVAASAIVNGIATVNLPAATYSVAIVTLPGFEGTLDGYAYNIATVTAITTTAQINIVPADALGDETITYTVTVLLPEGAPVPNIYVQLCGGPSSACYPRMTNENGVAVFELPAGDYEVHIEHIFWPLGYQFDDNTYKMTAEGGELTVEFEYIIFYD